MRTPNDCQGSSKVKLYYQGRDRTGRFVKSLVRLMCMFVVAIPSCSAFAIRDNTDAIVSSWGGWVTRDQEGLPRRVNLAIGTYTRIAGSEQDWALMGSPDHTDHAMSSSDFETLATLKGIRELDISGQTLTSRRTHALSRLGSLEMLTIAGTELTDDSGSHLSALIGLRSLNVAGTEVTDEFVKTLLSLEKLETVVLDNTRITNAGLNKLIQHPSLKTLVIRGNLVSDEDLRTLTTNARHLKIITKRPDGGII